MLIALVAALVAALVGGLGTPLITSVAAGYRVPGERSRRC
jgi:hypothetical protein